MSHATLLGALMLDGAAFPDVAKIVGPDDFSEPRPRLVFEAMADLAGDGAPLDAVTVCEHLRASGALDRAGGVAALAALVDQAPGAHSALRLARALTEETDGVD